MVIFYVEKENERKEERKKEYLFRISNFIYKQKKKGIYTSELRFCCCFSFLFLKIM